MARRLLLLEAFRGRAAARAVAVAVLLAGTTGCPVRTARGGAVAALDPTTASTSISTPISISTPAPPDPELATTSVPADAPVSDRPRAAPEETAIARQLFEEALRLERDGSLVRAAATFERAYDSDPDLAHAGVNAAVLRERLGELDVARALYGRILDENPGFGPAVRSLVRLAIRRGDLAGAEQEARARLARGPESAPLLDALVDVLLAGGRLDDAEEASRRALKLDEKDVPAMVNLATVYHRKKRNELAKMVLENAKLVDDRHPTVWNRLGFVELALGNRAQALEDFRAAAALGPDYPEARANYGALLADAEDFQNAAVELEAAVRHAPTSAAAWLGLGNAYRGAQKFEQAEEAYRKALELDAGLTEVQFNLAVLYLDGEKPGLPALARLEQAVTFFDAYEQKGGKEPKIADYRKDAAKAIEREKKRVAREERDRLRRDAEAKKKEDEARKEAEAAAQKAEEARLAELARRAALEPAGVSSTSAAAADPAAASSTAAAAAAPVPASGSAVPASGSAVPASAAPAPLPDPTLASTTTSTSILDPAPASTTAGLGVERGDR